MAFLSANDLAMMRAAQVSALPDTCSILRSAPGWNEIGEGTLGWSTVGTAVPCRVRLSNVLRRLEAIGGQAQAVADWVVTLAYDEDVRSGDRLTVGGDTYDVISVNVDESWRTAVRAECKRVGA